MQRFSAGDHPDSWRARLGGMEDWYAQFAQDEATALAQLSYDYGFYRQIISRLKGRVLDVGGGAGLAGAFLASDTEYVVIDPSEVWKQPVWRTLREKVGPNNASASYVQGVGEELPFPSRSFDAVLSMWSLNHASDPQKCISEIHRVSKNGANALIVLEDMEPAAYEIFPMLLRSVLSRIPGLHVSGYEIGVKKTIAHKVLARPWPLQDDHVRIDDSAFRGWLSGRFAVKSRWWASGFLSYDLVAV